MLYGRIGVTYAYEFELRVRIEGGGLQLSKIGGGQREDSAEKQGRWFGSE